MLDESLIASILLTVIVVLLTQGGSYMYSKAKTIAHTTMEVSAYVESTAQAAQGTQP